MSKVKEGHKMCTKRESYQFRKNFLNFLNITSTPGLKRNRESDDQCV